MATDQTVEADNSPDLAERMKVLEAQLKESQDSAEKLKKQAEVEAKEKRQFQSRFDKVPAPPPAPPPVPGLPTSTNPQQARLQQLESFANDAARENALLKEMVKRGLSEADVIDLEYETPTELRLALDLLQTRKEVQQLQQSSQAGPESMRTTAPPSPPIDTGGQTVEGVGPNVQRTDWNQKAQEIGHGDTAVAAKLQAIYGDNSKLMSVTSEELGMTSE